ncbi:MAG: (Fe-S)-binding protein [Candidatus Bathyarchaeia archaeon]
MNKTLVTLKEDILFCNRCRCGFCKSGCPAYLTFRIESLNARGVNLLALSLLEGRIPMSRGLAERFFACTSCGFCKEHCPLKVDTIEVVKNVRVSLLESGLAPPSVRDALENIYKYSNPWGEPIERRGNWVKDTEVRKYMLGDDFLYYVGCVGSYDARSMEATKALAEILLKCGLSFGVLGSDEGCDGNEVNLLGERGLFQILAERNIQKFIQLDVKKIVTLCPHAYNAIKNEYPKFGGNFEVMHYTQLLNQLIKHGRLEALKKVKAKVTYHDSCFLGRYNRIYDAPREILKSIPGVKLIEMPRNRENSLCCGGGGANFYTSLLRDGENVPSRLRVREAYKTGAEILAVACPICLIMLEDAVKTEGVDGELAVKDISEILKEAICV